MKIYTLIILSLALAASACGSCGESEKPCSPGDFQYCRDGNLVECMGEEEVSRPCGAGRSCVEGADRAQCIPDGEEFCDPESFEPDCHGDASFRDCSADGVTETTNCPTGDSCAIGIDGPMCVPEGEEPCDPATDEPSCSGDELITCLADGSTSTSSCAPDTCRVGSAGAVCVPSDAVECDFSGTQCFVGHVQECVDGFARAVIACGANDVCIIDECFADDTPTCDHGDKPRCEASGRIECDTTYKVFRSSPCPDDGTCASDPLAGAVCLTSDEEACDPADFTPHCVDAATSRRCIASAGTTLTTTCGAGESCQTTETGGWCAPDGAQPCDPVSFDATCSGQTATTCDIARHVVVAFDCPAGTACLDDDFGNLYRFAGCYPDTLPDCSEPSHQGCADSNTFQWCIGGKLLTQRCDLGSVCYGGGLRAECRPAEAPACSVFGYERTCVGPNSLRECFAGYEIVTACDRVGGRCDDTTPGAAFCAY